MGNEPKQEDTDRAVAAVTFKESASRRSWDGSTKPLLLNVVWCGSDDDGDGDGDGGSHGNGVHVRVCVYAQALVHEYGEANLGYYIPKEPSTF